MNKVRCGNCQTTVATAADGKCPDCGMMVIAGSQSSGIPTFTVRPAARPKVMPMVEVGITIDRTGSSATFAEGITKSLPLILDPINGRARDVKVWLQTHGDHDCGQEEVLLTDGATSSQAIADAGSIVYEGGGDASEHHLDGVETLHRRIPWNPDPREARGALVAITTADSKPARSGRSASEIGSAIKESGIILYVIGQPTSTLIELVKAAGGFFFEISNDPQVTEMRRIADMVAASITASLSSLTATRPAPEPTVQDKEGSA